MVFLSYAKEDIGAVQRLYSTFAEAGIVPWMDAPPEPYRHLGIPPGAEWEPVIRERLKSADVALLLLSATSVAKRGYVQKEIRLALEVASTRQFNEGYLIPVLLDDCRPPDLRVDTISLHDLQWYKLYEDGIDVLVKHLKAKLSGSGATSPALDDPAVKLEIASLRNRLAAAVDHELQWQRNQHDRQIRQLEAERNAWRDEAIDSGRVAYEKPRERF